jgi:hypothetical protein
MLIGERNGMRLKEAFEITKANYKEFNDNPSPIKSSGVKKLQAKIRRRYKNHQVLGNEKTFSWTLSSLK